VVLIPAKRSRVAFVVARRIMSVIAVLLGLFATIGAHPSSAAAAQSAVVVSRHQSSPGETHALVFISNFGESGASSRRELGKTVSAAEADRAPCAQSQRTSQADPERHGPDCDLSGFCECMYDGGRRLRVSRTSVAANTDPHDIEGRTGHDPDEIAQGIEGHTGDRFKPGVADEIAEVLRDPNAPTKPTDTGVAVRNVGRGRTIFVNDKQPWRSTAVNESGARWGRR
jgi:hypothetical protein